METWQIACYFISAILLSFGIGGKLGLHYGRKEKQEISTSC